MSFPMIIGIPREIKPNEERVALTPSAVSRLVKENNKVLIEKDAGIGAGYTNEEYKTAGAQIIHSHEKIFESSDMIIKVKEPLPEEYPLLNEGQILFTFLHLAASKELTEALLKRKIIGIAYETVQTEDGDLPLLAPMSEIAGRMAPLIGAHYLMKPFGIRGVLASGIPGVPQTNIVIIGAGRVGTNAIRIALGLGARVTVLDRTPKRLRIIEDIFRGTNLTTITMDEQIIKTALTFADVIIIGVLIPGAKAPVIIKRDMLQLMKPGALIIDVSIDQGGTTETSRPTTHQDPVYEVKGIIHYCVANMPGAVPRTSTRALSMSTVDYVSKIASLGWKRASLENPPIASGINMIYGKITHSAVAQSFGMRYIPVTRAM